MMGALEPQTSVTTLTAFISSLQLVWHHTSEITASKQETDSIISVGITYLGRVIWERITLMSFICFLPSEDFLYRSHYGSYPFWYFEVFCAVVDISRKISWTVPGVLVQFIWKWMIQIQQIGYCYIVLQLNWFGQGFICSVTSCCCLFIQLSIWPVFARYGQRLIAIVFTDIAI